MSEFPSLVTKLEQKRQELARLEIELAQTRRKRLESLAADFGFTSPDELIAALADFASPSLKRRIRQGSEVAEAKSATSHTRRRRAVVTPSLRNQIVAEIKAREKTAREIALKYGVSASLVNQTKQKLGLTMKRS